MIAISRVSARIEKKEDFLVKILNTIFSLGNPSYKDLSRRPLEGHMELIHNFHGLATFFHWWVYFFLVELEVLPLEFFRRSWNGFINGRFLIGQMSSFTLDQSERSKII